MGRAGMEEGWVRKRKGQGLAGGSRLFDTGARDKREGRVDRSGGKGLWMLMARSASRRTFAAADARSVAARWKWMHSKTMLWSARQCPVYKDEGVADKERKKRAEKRPALAGTTAAIAPEISFARISFLTAV